MKTDIFKDLVPLKEMTWAEVYNLGRTIVDENQDNMSKHELNELVDKVKYLLVVIKENL